MKYESGEIHISPKTIYWVQTPGTLNDLDKVELLKRDVLLLNHDGDVNEILKLREKDERNSAFFYNLDGILTKNRITNDTVYEFSKKIADFINSFVMNRSLVYTTMLDDKLASIFRNEGIVFFEKNLNDKRLAMSTIMQLISPFFIENNKVKRSYLRLNLLPLKHGCKITVLSKNNLQISGFLKDLSINGVGIILLNPDDASNIKIKDILELRISIKGTLLKISKGITTRVDPVKGEIGISYNINDSRMIREDYASILTGMIYDWIKKLIESNDRLV